MDWASGGRILRVVARRCARRGVPKNFWQAFLLINHPLLAKFWGPIVDHCCFHFFVCSVVTSTAAVLWNGDISFVGVIAFNLCLT